MPLEGYKIRSYEAGSVYAVNRGVRRQYDSIGAVLTKSLFSDYMVAHGMNVRGESTRDFICMKFSYGSRSYEEEVNRLHQTLEAHPERQEFIDEMLAEARQNKDRFDKKGAGQIREIFYRDGVTIHYSNEDIHYRRIYRSVGKAKLGQCIFVRDSLYDTCADYLLMGIKFDDNDYPVVEVGAYSSLACSTIVGKININPRNILILKDFDSSVLSTATSIEIDGEHHCHAVKRRDYPITNTMFDGQGLIDLSIFPAWADGYVLLRQRFTKLAAFATDIQGFFRDYYGDAYESATVMDMFGNQHYVKDIVLITTNNAIKWVKFGVSYDYWCDKVAEDDNMFGIVKTAHKSKLGNVQRMSYQMVNSLDENSIDEVLKPSLDYMKSLKQNVNVFVDFLKKNANFSNDFDVLAELFERNPDFERSDYFREKRAQIIHLYLWNLKNGRIIQNADNLVIVGNPYGMLMYAVGENPEEDPTFDSEDGTVQCYTGRFDDGRYLAGFRSPFNGRANMDYLHNHYHPYFDKYFRLGKLIVAVNMIHTDFQDRNNGLIYWVSV